MRLAPSLVAAVALTSLLVGPSACNEPVPEPVTSEDRPRPIPKGDDSGGKQGARARPDRPKPERRPVKAQPVATVPVSADDPLAGKLTLDDATKGLTGEGALVASIETDKGTLECALFADKAPITVANFVGLARGVRPWKTPGGTWEKKPAYDGTVFHRVIKGFMIQGGDAAGNGSGEPGYVIPDEVWEGATHDRAGLLCMANRGPNTNGAQFFITDDAAFHLDFNERTKKGGYTIFGECAPLDVVHALASVPMGAGDRPASPPLIKSVTISRRPKAGDAGDAGAPAAPGSVGSASATAAPSSAPSSAPSTAPSSAPATKPSSAPSSAPSATPSTPR